MEKRKTIVVIEKGEDGTYSAYPKDLKATIIGEGDTASEAKKDFLNSYKEVKDFYLDTDGVIPEYLDNLDFEYTFDIPAFFNYFDFINISKFAQAIGVEPSLMRHYKSGDTTLSPKQRERILKGIKGVASELMEVIL